MLEVRGPVSQDQREMCKPTFLSGRPQEEPGSLEAAQDHPEDRVEARGNMINDNV